MKREIAITAYKCKKCGAKLAISKFNVEVKRMDGSFS